MSVICVIVLITLQIINMFSKGACCIWQFPMKSQMSPFILIRVIKIVEGLSAVVGCIHMGIGFLTSKSNKRVESQKKLSFGAGPSLPSGGEI